MASSEPTPVPETKKEGGIQRFFVILFQSGAREDHFGGMDRFVFRHIQEKLEEKIKVGRDEAEIDLWLESPGGDAHVAYKLFLELRSRAAKFRVIIPDYAKSAATLLAIGADEIWMAPAAELGPLDAQFEHPDREGVTVSALDMTNALGFLVETATKHLVLDGGRVLKSTDLRRIDILERFSKFLADFFHPIVAKLDPHLIHKATNELEVARRYATSMLRLREGTKGERGPNAGLAQCLIKHYPSHGFVISRRAVEEFGLPVKPAEEYDYWSQLKLLFSAYSDGTFAEDGEEGYRNSLIEVFSEKQLMTFSGELATQRGIAEDEGNEHDDISPEPNEAG